MYYERPSGWLCASGDAPGTRARKVAGVLVTDRYHGRAGTTFAVTHVHLSNDIASHVVSMDQRNGQFASGSSAARAGGGSAEAASVAAALGRGGGTKQRGSGQRLGPTEGVGVHGRGVLFVGSKSAILLKVILVDPPSGTSDK